MTAVAEDLDLGSVAGFAPDCDVRECEPLPAAAICWWDPPECCGEGSPANLLCATHRDTASTAMARGNAWRCDFCGMVRRIARMEPLR